MEYNGKYRIFDTSGIKTYPISTRTNKVTAEDIVNPDAISGRTFNLADRAAENISAVAGAVIDARKNGRPVIFFTGAHLIKNGLGPLIIDLVNRDMITLAAGNGATAIHDFELALVGQTSEYVPDALEKGRFGMAYEFVYQNAALKLGDRYNLGYGESLAKMICDESFSNEVFQMLNLPDNHAGFRNPQFSILAACYKKNIPFTVHVGIGTDVIDQHPSSDPASKGACSGRDFLIYTDQVSQLADGGVILNIGSAVTGPEVLLKAVSMAANTNRVPNKIITADFDLRKFEPDAMTDESAENYYYRDQKSVVTRIPGAFGGQGFYIQANLNDSIPMLYKTVIESI